MDSLLSTRFEAESGAIKLVCELTLSSATLSFWQKGKSEAVVSWNVRKEDGKRFTSNAVVAGFTGEPCEDDSVVDGFSGDELTVNFRPKGDTAYFFQISNRTKNIVCGTDLSLKAGVNLIHELYKFFS